MNLLNPAARLRARVLRAVLATVALPLCSGTIHTPWGATSGTDYAPNGTGRGLLHQHRPGASSSTSHSGASSSTSHSQFSPSQFGQPLQPGRVLRSATNLDVSGTQGCGQKTGILSMAPTSAGFSGRGVGSETESMKPRPYTAFANDHDENHGSCHPASPPPWSDAATATSRDANLLGEMYAWERVPAGFEELVPRTARQTSQSSVARVVDEITAVAHGGEFARGGDAEDGGDEALHLPVPFAKKVRPPVNTFERTWRTKGGNYSQRKKGLPRKYVVDITFPNGKNQLIDMDFVGKPLMRISNQVRDEVAEEFLGVSREQLRAAEAVAIATKGSQQGVVHVIPEYEFDLKTRVRDKNGGRATTKINELRGPIVITLTTSNPLHFVVGVRGLARGIYAALYSKDHPLRIRTCVGAGDTPAVPGSEWAWASPDKIAAEVDMAFQFPQVPKFAVEAATLAPASVGEMTSAWNMISLREAMFAFESARVEKQLQQSWQERRTVEPAEAGTGGAATRSIRDQVTPEGRGLSRERPLRLLPKDRGDPDSHLRSCLATLNIVTESLVGYLHPWRGGAERQTFLTGDTWMNTTLAKFAPLPCWEADGVDKLFTSSSLSLPEGVGWQLHRTQSAHERGGDREQAGGARDSSHKNWLRLALSV